MSANLLSELEEELAQTHGMLANIQADIQVVKLDVEEFRGRVAASRDCTDGARFFAPLTQTNRTNFADVVGISSYQYMQDLSLLRDLAIIVGLAIPIVALAHRLTT